MAPPIHPASTPRTNASTGFAPAIVTRVLDQALSIAATPPIFGIVGLQGSGKSTLAKQLVAAGKLQGLAVVALSLDDFYLTVRERLALGKHVHPLLSTRGPPGSHDLALACRTLDSLRQLPAASVVTPATIETDSVRLPVFDKLGDRRLPPSRWPVVTSRPDLIIFEGWFLGVPPQAQDALTAPINSLERDEDDDGRWRHYCNAALAQYAPLWCRIDRLLFLQAPGFDVVPRWRWQQEQALAGGKKTALCQEEVARFVLFFERISRHALATLPRLADQVLHLDDQRQLIE